MILATLDTNVVVSGLRSRTGASYRILQAVEAGRIVPAIGVSLYLEYESVLTRPEQLAVSGLTVEDVAGFLRDLAVLGEPVTRMPYRWRPMLPDADDDMVVECAVFSGSQYLVTMNVGDFEAIRGRFRFELVTPGELIRAVEE